eukprot:3110206-Pleurochrysis_carterae.AAC.1
MILFMRYCIDVLRSVLTCESRCHILRASSTLHELFRGCCNIAGGNKGKTTQRDSQSQRNGVQTKKGTTFGDGVFWWQSVPQLCGYPVSNAYDISTALFAQVHVQEGARRRGEQLDTGRRGGSGRLLLWLDDACADCGDGAEDGE